MGTSQYQGHRPLDVLYAVAGLVDAATIITAGGKMPQGSKE